jgi:uracil-DNA glycosylase family 4
VTLGNFATKLLLGRTEGITQLRGRAYPYRAGHLVPTFHPSAVLRSPGLEAQMRADLVRAKQLIESTAGSPSA